MSLALSKTPIQQSEINELLALVYYDGIQNVVPIYDQRSVLPTKDESWITFCQNSMSHFEKAFSHKPDWSHAFYLGKLCVKLGYPYEKAFSYYEKAINLNPSAVDPFYRMHTSRLKLLHTCGKHNLEALKETAMNLIGQTVSGSPNFEGNSNEAKPEGLTNMVQLDEAWHVLYSDCLSAIEVCVEGELKHFHKARYTLAQGWYRKGESGDLERAKDELSFCFKSSRSSFTINMWEIDGMVRKGSLCLEDLVPVALVRYIQSLVSSIHQAETLGSADVSCSPEHWLEKLFNLFMDQGNVWTDISSLPEIKRPELSESSFYG
ncbi:hypothetical protein MKX03_033781 [Papaver bracteatum]|nr:hypothetical protein MKX03_033781 [Papaver bracteatum]